jgi:hypothetical protein
MIVLKGVKVVVETAKRLQAEVTVQGCQLHIFKMVIVN